AWVGSRLPKRRQRRSKSSANEPADRVSPRAGWKEAGTNGLPTLKCFGDRFLERTGETRGGFRATRSLPGFCPRCATSAEARQGRTAMSTRLVVRVTAPVLVISGLLLMIGVVAAWYVQRMQRTVSEDLLWNVHTMRAGEELEIYLREVGRQLNLFRI